MNFDKTNLKKPCIDLQINMPNEIEEVRMTEWVPDTRWRGRDANGHLHKWRRRGKCFDVASCKQKKTEHPEECGECGTPTGEMYTITILVCRRCGDEVEPRTRSKEVIKHISKPLPATGTAVFNKPINLEPDFRDLSDICDCLSGTIAATSLFMGAGGRLHINFTVIGLVDIHPERMTG